MKELQTVTLGDCKEVSSAIEYMLRRFSADAMIESLALVGSESRKVYSGSKAVEKRDRVKVSLRSERRQLK